MIFLDFSLFSSVLLRFIFCIYFCWYFDDGLGWDGFSLSLLHSLIISSIFLLLMIFFSFSFHLQYLLTVWLKWKLTHGQYAHKRITTCLYHIILSSQPNPNKLVEFLPFLFFSSFALLMLVVVLIPVPQNLVLLLNQLFLWFSYFYLCSHILCNPTTFYLLLPFIFIYFYFWFSLSFHVMRWREKQQFC